MENYLLSCFSFILFYIIIDISFRDAFVLTHSTFVDPIELIRLLCNRWDISPPATCEGEAQLKLFTETVQKPIRIKYEKRKKKYQRYYLDII